MKVFEKPLTPQEEQEMILRLQKNDKEAEEILIRKNLRLVAHMVKKYASSDQEAEDMISIGTIGLMKAIRSFNPSKGSRFATYAAKCIDNELLMNLRANKKHRKDISINEPLGVDKEGNEISLIDFLECKDCDASRLYELKCEICWLQKTMKEKLSKREQQIIALRYGLIGEAEKTQNEIAKMLGISRSYVSRIEKKALCKLRDNYR